MSARHTPEGFTPLDCIGTGEILDADGEVYFSFDYGDAASRKRAEFVTGACNSHDDLLRAAQRALNVFKAQGESIRPNNVLAALSAAIAKATGAA